MVVLNELHIQSDLAEFGFGVAFKEKAPIVAEHLRLDDQHARQFRFLYVQNTLPQCRLIDSIIRTRFLLRDYFSRMFF